MSSGKNTISLRAPDKFKADFKRMLDTLATDIEASVRPAAQAGAQVLYDAVKLNVSSMGRVTGNLDKSIYQVFSRDRSGQGLATYHVSWNHIKAPHGHLVEYGHVQRYATYFKDGRWHTNKKKPLAQPRQVAARPFIRPAVAKFPEAVAAMETELARYLNEGPTKARGYV